MKRTTQIWTIAIISYFAMQVILRTLFGAGLGKDEAEMILAAQSLEWGYGPQPPLYAWIQHFVFHLFGATVFSLALVKNSLLCVTCLALYRLLRTSFPSDLSGMSILSLTLLPQFCWESQRALTHSVLVTTASVVTALIFLRLIETRSLKAYLAFGLAITAGFLTKFNYPIALGAMLIGALSIPAARNAVLHPRLLLSFGIAGILLFRPLRWMLENPTRVLGSSRKFEIKGEGLSIAFKGGMELGITSLLFVIVLVVVLAGLYLRYRQTTEKQLPASTVFSFLSRTIVAGLMIIFVIVILSGTTNVKDRWLQPLFVFAGPVLAIWVLPRLTATGLRRWRQMTSFVALFVLCILPIYNTYGFGEASKRAAPFDKVSEALMSQFPEPEVVFTDSQWVGANLHLVNKKWAIETREYRSGALNDNVLLVWKGKKPEVPPWMIRHLQQQKNQVVSLGAVTSLEMSYPHRPETTLVLHAAEVHVSPLVD